jgi:hypothetical protein
VLRAPCDSDFFGADPSLAFCLSQSSIRFTGRATFTEFTGGVTLNCISDSQFTIRSRSAVCQDFEENRPKRKNIARVAESFVIALEHRIAEIDRNGAKSDRTGSNLSPESSTLLALPSAHEIHTDHLQAPRPHSREPDGAFRRAHKRRIDAYQRTRVRDPRAIPRA